jgi:hypothetical protein
MTRWLPSAALRLARPRKPCLAACVATTDRQARAQAVLPQPSGSHFQTRWNLRFLLHRCHHATVLEPFTYPARRFLHAWDQRHLHSLHKHGTHPVSRHCPRGWTSDLFSSQQRPELTSTGLNLMTTARQRHSICRLFRCFKSMIIKIKLCEI